MRAWTTCCATVCALTMACEQPEMDALDPAPPRLTVMLTGPGRVTSTEGALDCPGRCSVVADAGTILVLTAEPSDIGQLDAWGGPCADAGTTCTVMLEQPRTIAAFFSDVGPGSVAWQRVAITPCKDTSRVTALAASKVDDTFWLGGLATDVASFGGPVSMTTMSLQPYVARYDADGGYLLARTFQFRDVVDALDAFDDGGLLVVGRGFPNIDGGTIIGGVCAFPPLFVQRRAESGEPDWTQPFQNSLCAGGRGVTYGGKALIAGVGARFNEPDPASLTTLDEQGQRLRSIELPKTPTTTAAMTALAVARTGRVALAGAFNGTLWPDGGAITSVGTGAFVALLEGEQVVWARAVGDRGARVSIGSIALDENDDVFVYGQFTGTLTIDGSTTPAAGIADVFVARLSGATGQSTWVATLGGPGEDHASAMTLTLRGLAISGDFENQLSLGATTLLAAGRRDAFVAGLSRAGRVLWARTYGGASDDAAGALVQLRGQRLVVTAGVNLRGAVPEPLRLGAITLMNPDGGLPITVSPGVSSSPSARCHLLMGLRLP